MKGMRFYYQLYCGNFCIPVTKYTKEIEHEVIEFLKAHRDYFLMYLSTDDGYEEDMLCVTNFLE